VNVVGLYSQPELEGTKFDGAWVAQISREEVLEKLSDLSVEVDELIQVFAMWPIRGLCPPEG
jgi:hypothetical protein